MHAILIAIGSAGDVFPFIGLARTLKLRGHRVSLCTIPVFRDAVEQHGIAFVPLSDELTYRRTMGDPRLWDPKTSFGVLWQAIAGMIEPVYEYVSAQRHDDIVVVGSLWALGARIAHEKYGIPYLSAQVSPSTLLSAHLPPVHPKFNVPEQMPLAMRKLLWRCIERFKLDRTCAPEINAVRRKVGLETPVKRIFTQWMHSPQGVVCLFPAWFAPPQQDWPQPLHMTGFPLFDGSIPGTPLDDELQRFLDQGSRPLVFTQGSTEHLQGDFYAMALRALERLGARGIFLTGAGQEPLRGLPNHVLQRAYAPLGALLPSCAGLVHPGGIGAMSLALAAGLWWDGLRSEMQPIHDSQGVFAVLEKEVRRLGFDYYAYGVRHTIPFTRPKTEVHGTYPKAWLERYQMQNYGAVDPAILNGLRSSEMVVWSDSLFDQSRMLWNEARDWGLCVGATLPIRAPNNLLSVLSVARDQQNISSFEREEIRLRLRCMIELLTQKLTDLEHPMLMSNPVCLSHREREILQWTADGKSSGEIAIILSISESTVNFHHKNIQKKFDAPNKTLAAAYAAALGLI